MGFKIKGDDFAFEAKHNKIKKFDERGDIAAKDWLIF